MYGKEQSRRVPSLVIASACSLCSFHPRFLDSARPLFIWGIIFRRGPFFPALFLPPSSWSSFAR
jgi:hypothetical protein